MPYFDGSRGRVFYRRWAIARPRAALIFAHGLGEYSGLYRRFADEIGARGVEVWALDLHGHGLSDGERGHFGPIDALADDLRQLARIAATENPALPQAIGGHSLGSLVAVSVLLAGTEGRLAGTDRFAAAVISGAPLSPVPWLVDLAAGPETVPDASFELDPAALSSDPEYLQQLATDPLVFTSVDGVAELAAAFPPVWQRLQDDHRRLATPILAVHGTADAIAPLDGVTPWEGRLADLRIEAIDGAGHDVLNEVEHRRIADRIGRFIVVRADLLARAS